MKLFQNIIYFLIIFTKHYYEVESCLTSLQYLDLSNVKCDNISDPFNCTVTCNPGHMFDDGSTSRVYQCQNNSFTTPLYKNGCLPYISNKRENSNQNDVPVHSVYGRTSPILKIKLFVDYKFTTLALYCLDKHTDKLEQNKELFRNQVTNVCNRNSISDVLNISISNITSKASSFSIFTTFDIEFDNTLLSQNKVESCAELILSNTKSGAILMYATRLACLVGQTNVSISSKHVDKSTTFCPAYYQPNDDKNAEVYCDSTLPLVGVRQFKYVSDSSSNVNLYCEVAFGSSSNTLVYWEHNEEQIDITPRFSGSTVIHPSLMIQNLTYNDSGKYTCNAKNKFGRSTSIPISLSVINDTSADRADGSTTSQIAGTTRSITHLQSTDFITQSDASFTLTGELSTKHNSSLREVLTDGKDTTTGKTIIGLSVVAVLGWTIVVILVVYLLYQRKHCFRQLRNRENETLNYDDLNRPQDVSEQSRYSSIEMETVPSAQYEFVANCAEYVNSTDTR